MTNLFRPSPIIIHTIGILSILIGIFVSTLLPNVLYNTYPQSFTSMITRIQNVECIDVSNKAISYTIPLPITPLNQNPPQTFQTTPLTFYWLYKYLTPQPYYELHILANHTSWSQSRELQYDAKFKFMNECVDFSTTLVHSFMWGTSNQAYVYSQDTSNYPFAYPAFDPSKYYTFGALSIVSGVFLILRQVCINRRESFASVADVNTWQPTPMPSLSGYISSVSRSTRS